MDTFFIVYVNTDGTLTTTSQWPDEAPEVGHSATNWDVYQAAKQIVDEFESNILASKVARAVVSSLMPSVPAPADAVKDALKERGINPESPASDA